jgi:hypothetical protein
MSGSILISYMVDGDVLLVCAYKLLVLARGVVLPRRSIKCVTVLDLNPRTLSFEPPWVTYWILVRHVL